MITTNGEIPNYLFLAHWDTRAVADKDSNPFLKNNPMIGANALQLRITQHKRIFEALKIPYHGEDKSTKESQELYDVVEKYIEIKYPELTLGSVGKTLKRKFGKERKERKEKDNGL